jgi:Calcineurin-like phosphoesterase
MKIPMLFANLLIGSFLLGQDSAHNIDGPYIFYQDGTIRSSEVNNDSVYNRIIDKNGSKIVAVTFPDQPTWNFTVELRKKLTTEDCIFRQPEKILFISDIEGEFEALRMLLINNKVIDDKYAWIFGNGHLVICGDLFDRGKQVVQELWLLYKLEDEAKANGGYVHTLLGNHDIMNLSGDTRYVEPFYLSDAALMGKPYRDLYSKNTELGRWLRTKNIIEKVGDNLCLHAGVSAIINASGVSVDQINTICRPLYDQGTNDRVLDSAGVYPFFGENGIFWYRGYFQDPRSSKHTIDSSLYLFRCRRIIVGHTILTRNPAMYYGGRVIGIDVNEHVGHRAGVLYNEKKWWIVDGEGNMKIMEYDPANDMIGTHQAEN